ncbi:beta-lactamase domain-containing protein 2-like [Plakobranchus ocellatus]|uniref:Beta-lactamase domain-containing protein 2-like n=1 Tax=Plakobranchus ocellatus TaxID=259542 RepID=A0AAV4B3Q3_9GAST|nr:beta-lactamase domain-containing protein 2-like [Plakobranchus ocellatus]
MNSFVNRISARFFKDKAVGVFQEPHVSQPWRVAVALCVVAAAWNWSHSWFAAPRKDYQVEGYVHPAFEEVRDVFKESLASGAEGGASFSVHHQGQVLVDIWGGRADPTTGALWQRDTLSQAWSCTKGLAAVSLAMLVDRGLLDYEELVTKYWPEFHQNGKDNITVGTLFSHRAGLISLGRQISLQEYRDNWPEIERLLAAAKPAWNPGSHYMYHAFTFGMYADAVVRKVDPKHRNISQFAREELAEPLGLDYYIGLPFDQHYRATKAEYVSMIRLFLSTVLLRPERWHWLPEALFGNRLQDSVSVLDIYDDMSLMEDPELRSIGLASMVGFGNARSLARLYDFIGNNGSVQGKRLLSEEQIKYLTMPATVNASVIVAPDEDFTMGLIDAKIHGRRIAGHNGYGGQSGFADAEAGIGVGYVTNFNSVYADRFDPRMLNLMQAFYNGFSKYRALKSN